MAEQEGKSLAAWRLEIQQKGKSHWTVYYESFLDSPVSNRIRFFKALKLYGDWALFEAVLAASTAIIVGDPLNYVLKVAYLKWKEAQKDDEASQEYENGIAQITEKSRKQNEELKKKLKKAATKCRK